METVITSLKNTWNNLSLRTRIAGGAVAVTAFLLLMMIALFSGADYQPLYTNLELSDAAEITRVLSEKGIT